MAVGSNSFPSVQEAALGRCRAICAETLASYGGEDGDTAEREFAGTLLTMIAAIDAALDAAPERRERSVEAAAQIARGAAEQIRRYGFDEPILRCAAACEELAHRYSDDR